MISNDDELSPLQLRFVAEYLIELSGTQAAIRAAHGAKTARSIALENLTRPPVMAAIRNARQ